MTKKLKLVLIHCLLILIAATSFLFSPAPKSLVGFHGNYIHINKLMGFTVNGDSYAFCRVAQHPSLLMVKYEKRQSRPLYALLGTVFYIPLNILFNVAGFNPEHGVDTAINEVGRQAIPSFAGFIMINAITLLLAVLIFDLLLSHSGVKRNMIFLLLPVLLFNEPVKTFFWTAHQQIFNILVPLCCIWLLMKIANRSRPLTLIQLLFLSFICGILLLLYGNFLMMLPVIIIGAWLNSRFSATAFSVFHLLIPVIFFLIPTLLWIFFLNVFADGYYSHEITKYRQLVWITDELKNGILPFLRSWMIHSRQYFISILIVIPFILIAFALNLKKKIKIPVTQLSLKMASFIVFILFFFFLWFLGFYASRLSFALAPVLLVIIGLSMENHFVDSFKRYIPISFITAWVIYQVASYGPFY